MREAYNEGGGGDQRYAVENEQTCTRVCRKTHYGACGP